VTTTEQTPEKQPAQRHDAATASTLRRGAAKSLARLSGALLRLSKTLHDPTSPAPKPEENHGKAVNGHADKSRDVPLPPSLSVAEHDEKNFMAIRQGYTNIGIIPCYVNREASAAIVAIRRSGDTTLIFPMFVSVTHSMRLMDEHGNSMWHQLEDRPEAVAAKQMLAGLTKGRKG
jgi:hypothetical protein